MYCILLWPCDIPDLGPKDRLELLAILNSWPVSPEMEGSDLEVLYHVHEEAVLSGAMPLVEPQAKAPRLHLS